MQSPTQEDDILGGGVFFSSTRPLALQLSRELQKRFPSLVAQIQQGLFEHYLPYKEAVEAGIEMGSPFPQIADKVEVWSHVKPGHVLIEPINGQWRVEIAFTTDWDIEDAGSDLF